MSYEPNHYNIWTKPIFVKAEMEYPFEGLTANGAHRGANNL